MKNRESIRSGVVLLLAIHFLTTGDSAGAEIRVKADDSPSAKPINAAMEVANPGDILILEPGTYHETVRVEKAITLRALPGAILDGSTALKADWKAVEGMEGVFATEVRDRPAGLLVNGNFVPEIRFDRAQESGDWHWRTLLAKGTPLSAFDYIRALWMYHPKEQRIYLRLENKEAPAGANLSVVMSGKALVEITAADVVVEGLTLAAGVNGIVLGEGATNCVVRRCRIGSYESTGILLTNGASDSVVEDCDITRGALEEWQPSAENRRENYEIWRIHKDVGKYDRVGIQLIRAGSGNRILGNRLDRVFDGICLGDYRAESLDKPLPDPDHGRGTEIAWNVIENTRDSGIELGVGCVDVNVHHNTLRRTHGGLRFKAPRIGPVFIHHNRLIDGTPFNIWFSMDSSPAEGFVYHNTIIGGRDPALVYSSFNALREFATPKWHFLNNLVLTEEGFFGQHKKTPPADFIAAHNLSIGGQSPWPEDPGRDKGSRYGLDIGHDETGKPTPGSAAVDAGMDLSAYWNGKPLPGCEPGYFQGRAPDVGADEISDVGAP